MSRLPEALESRLSSQLGEEFPLYLEAMGRPAENGLRLNTLKWSTDRFLRTGLFSDGPVPWSPSGFHLAGGARPALHPYYAAGLYYLQEPSAMAPAAILPVEPGDRVLDLCAAPGGKTTELGARLKGRGFLVANDVSRSRARALLKNLELFGIGNAAVVCELPEKLAEAFPQTFDKILVDAPCSGEGMLRKEPSMAQAWERKGPEEYAPLQRSILRCAAAMLRPGGMLLYSTCTYSRQEDEENVLWLLSEDPTLSPVPIEKKGGMADGEAGLPEAARFWPHRVRGEGHFAALLKKSGEKEPAGILPETEAFLGKKQTVPDVLGQDPVFSLIQKDMSGLRALCQGSYVYAVPEDAVLKKGLGYLRTGLLLGERKKDRFEPFQALAMTLTPDEFANTADFPSDDIRVIKYLKGETVDCAGAENRGGNGWTLVCTDGFPLGFAKRTGTVLKNKYHTGWRWMA